MRFVSTQNIFIDNGEIFDENWMDSNKLILPPNPKWDYHRELQIKDIDIWEVIWEAGGGWGVYAAWCPYAEFYLLCIGVNQYHQEKTIETFYGKNAQNMLIKKTNDLNILLTMNKKWVDEEDMWLYQNLEQNKNLIII